MSLQAAIGQIDQILQLQQQILDPASSAAATAQTGGAGLSTAAAGASSGSFAGMLANAQATAPLTDPNAALESAALGAPTATPGAPSATASAPPVPASTTPTVTDPISSGLTDPILAPASTGATTSGGAPPALDAMVAKANSLVGLPYVWGGGHDNFGPQSGYDCSGFVSAVLHAGGYLSAPQDTQTLPGQAGIESGPGQSVTIYDRTDAGLGDDHVIIDLGGQFYESGGEHGAWGGGGGVEKLATPTAAYLATFNDVLHPQGL